MELFISVKDSRIALNGSESPLIDANTDKSMLFLSILILFSSANI